ncbi:MAG: hypothetical protein JWQ27_664 [Ferruginibacter sp.]|nr:hypothetical protein [Ferruginibacter sp.]
MLKAWKKQEDSLKTLSFKIINGINPSDRLAADSVFTRILVRALKQPNSFNYPFDSLNISKLYSPDSTFRIFTWQMLINENIVRQHGAIQMKTANGSLKLFPLIDKSDVTQNINDTIGNNNGWMGAVYYKIILTKYLNHPYYTLLGYDENNIRSNKKIIEVLDFKDGQPVFGGRYFSIENSNVYTKNMARFIMEFKKEAAPRLTFDSELNMIVMEHLVSETGEPTKKWTYIPDGDYEGFKWINGKWAYVSKIFNEVTAEGKEPVPQPIRDAKGNIDNTKLKGNELDPPAPIKKKVEDD